MYVTKKCWPTNHIKEQRDTVKKSLKRKIYNRFRLNSDYRDRSNKRFNQRVFQYMVVIFHPEGVFSTFEARE